MAAVRDSFIDLEKRRRQLEQNVTELRGLLQHWQTWEAEYEGLKEELEGLGSTASRQEIQAVTEDYEATLLNAKEISQLVKDDKGNDRDARQILGLLARRIDYVQENVKTVQKRYDDAELKLERINVVMQPSATDEEGLPLTEITEELDDNDNVICMY
jgi:unconventional prefoldin RPB5 interactor 1